MNYIIITVITFISFLLFKFLQKSSKSSPKIEVISHTDTSDIVNEIKKLVKITTKKITPDYVKPYRKYRFLLNSAERTSGTVENYILDLYEPIFSIEKIELMKASFPTSLKLINDYNNVLTLNNGVGVLIKQIILDKGYYNGDELATMLENKFVSAPTPLVGFTVTYDSNSGFLTFSYSSSISFPGVPVNIDYTLDLLGFPHTGSSSGTSVTGTLPANTAFPQNILVQLSSENYKFNSLEILSTEGKECFAFLQMPSGAGGGGFGTYIITKDQTNAYYKAYEGTIPQLNRLNVKLKQLLPNGTLVDADFNNINHTIEIEITARVDKSSLELTKSSLK